MPVSTRITGSPPDGEESTQTASMPDCSTTGRSNAASSPAYPVDGLTPNIAACCSCSAEPQTTTDRRVLREAEAPLFCGLRFTVSTNASSASG